MTVATASPVRTTMVLRGADRIQVPNHPSEPGSGVSVAEYLGPNDGAVHLAVALVQLEPNGSIRGHIHPFEESFFVLSGSARLNLGGQRFRIAEGDFGVVPIGTGHSWDNPFGQPAKLLRVYSPQPRPMIGGVGVWGVYAAPDVVSPTGEQAIDELNPRHNLVGHFAECDLPAPASILMPGYHGANIQNVSIRMMVDALLGARHHTLFVVEFAPTGRPQLSAREHFHPFEEMYFFLSGEAVGSFDGELVPIQAGDLVFAGVGASHGFSAVGDRPVRWIEAQAPLPPASDGFFFHTDWAKLQSLA